MRIEKWKLDDKEVEVPILDKEEIEVNEEINNDELDKTSEYIFELEKEGDKDAE